jgi:hypothetical protein
MNRWCLMGYPMPGDPNKVLSRVKINEMFASEMRHSA